MSFHRCFHPPPSPLPQLNPSPQGEVEAYGNAESVWNWTLKNTVLSFARDQKGLKNAQSFNGGTVQVIANDAFPGRVIQRGNKKKKLKTVASPKPKKEPKEPAEKKKGAAKKAKVEDDAE